MLREAILAVLLLVAPCLAGSDPDPQNFLVGIPHSIDGSMAAQIESAVSRLVRDGRPGSRIRVFDAELQQLVDMTIPTSEACATSERARRLALKARFAQLKAALGALSAEGGQPLGSLRVPQFLVLCGTAMQASSAHATIVLVGRPTCIDPREPFRFGAGLVPSDGHILARSTQSPYGCSDRAGLLQGVAVHYCYLREDFGSEAERAAVTRFWSLYVGTGLKGVLASYAASLDLVLDRATTGKTEPVDTNPIDPRDTAIVMRRISTAAPVIVDDTPDVSQRPASPQAPAESSPPPAAPSSATEAATQLQHTLDALPAPEAGTLDIAIAWVTDGAVLSADVDLYVRAGTAADELCFSRTATSEGVYVRDIRNAQGANTSSPWAAAEWELVHLAKSKDGDVSCWLDVYQGSGAPLRGLLRVSFGGQVRDQAFSFPAVEGDPTVEGDHASHRRDRENSSCWLRMRLPSDIVAAWRDQH